MMQRILIMMFTLLISLMAQASPDGSVFIKSTKGLEHSDKNHSYCMRDENSRQTDGENEHSRVRIASVSKLATSYWALKTYGPFYRFNTRLIYNESTGQLHIMGSRDPLFGRNRVYGLLSELNRQGITQVSELSFDSQFKVFVNVEDQVRSSLGTTGGVSGKDTKDNLEIFFNTSRWDTFSRYEAAANQAKSNGFSMVSRVSFTAPRIYEVSELPFSPAGQLKIWDYQSKPLYEILKLMNVESHNYVADEIFNGLGGTSPFARFMRETLGFDGQDIRFYTGSGLPITIGGQRRDNEATCVAILDIMQKSKDLLKRQANLDLPDVMLVTGRDRGTLKKYNDKDFDASMVAKTGTTNYSISMAGQFSTEDGKHFYGIYLQVPSASFWGQAWSVRDQIIKGFLQLHGGGVPMNYKTVSSFFPMDKGSHFRAEFDGDTKLR